MYVGRHVAILLRVQWNLNFLDRFSKSTQISNCLKILVVGVELFRADGRTDGQTDMTKPTVAFLSFAHAPSH